MNAHKLICGLLCWLIALPAWSSYAIYIGKNLTADGSVMIGGSGDEDTLGITVAFSKSNLSYR